MRYVGERALSEGMRWLVCLSLPAAAILLPVAFFLSVVSPDATEPNAPPNALIYLAYVGAVSLAAGLLALLGAGLIRGRQGDAGPKR